MNFYPKIEDLLDDLSREKELLVLCKATDGYSAVIMTHKEYAETFILKKHFNGHTIEEAIEELTEELTQKKEK